MRIPMNIPTTVIPIPMSMFMRIPIPMSILIPMTTCMNRAMNIITIITIMSIIMSIPMHLWTSFWL
jgi:hypothetical protein